MGAMFQYELCSYPTSLFESSFIILKPQKPALADAIWARLPSDPTGPTGGVQYVLDGDRKISYRIFIHSFFIKFHGHKDSPHIKRSVTYIVGM